MGIAYVHDKQLNATLSDAVKKAKRNSVHLHLRVRHRVIPLPDEVSLLVCEMVQALTTDALQHLTKNTLRHYFIAILPLTASVYANGKQGITIEIATPLKTAYEEITSETQEKSCQTIYMLAPIQQKVKDFRCPGWKIHWHQCIRRAGWFAPPKDLEYCRDAQIFRFSVIGPKLQAHTRKKRT